MEHVHRFVADVIKTFNTVDRGFLDRDVGPLGLLPGVGRFILGTMLMSGSGSSLLLVLGRPEQGMAAFHRVAT